MARINTTIDVSPDEVENDIGAWANSSETRNFAFLVMMCQALQNKMRAYYKAGATYDERVSRLKEIREELTRIVLTDNDGYKYTIAPEAGRACPGDEKYVSGACVNS